MPDVPRPARPERYPLASPPSQPEHTDAVLAIDRWNNEGGFVAERDAGLDSWLRRRGPRSDR